MGTWHERIVDEAPAYLTGELPPAARTAVERHLRRCAACRQEFARLRETLADLAEDGPVALPPAPLREAILEAARREGPPAGGTVRRPLAWRQGAALAAACLLAASTSVLALQLRAERRAYSLLLAQSSAAHRQQGGVQVMTLQATAATGDPQATAALALVPAPLGTEAVAVVSGLPALQGTQVYQLWYIHGGVPVSAGVLTYRQGVALFRGTLPSHLTVQAAAVSREPQSGDTHPEGPIVLQS